ncbi:MAG: hypothetical protein ACRC3B_01300 [Bacteroidia bacterium]
MKPIIFIPFIMTSKQRLILFFIETKFADNQYSLVKYLDRSSYFPSELSENLNPLLENEYIIVRDYLSNGTPFSYSITEKGKEYLNTSLNPHELIDFANSCTSPEFMIKIIYALINKRNSLY